MNIYILGAAGWIPGKNETSCILIEHKKKLFILDAGTGISNITKYQSIISNYDTIYVLLSHYHLDHTIGFIYLDPYVRNKRIRIFGPGRMSYPETTSYYLHELLRTEFFARSIDKFSDDVQIFDFPSNTFYVDDTKISVMQQQHSAPSFRISIDDKLIYATDTTFQATAWNGIRSNILLHECWDYKEITSDRHTTLKQLLTQLPRHNFEKILLIHQNPNWNEDDIETISKIISNTNIVLAKDGDCIKDL